MKEHSVVISKAMMIMAKSLGYYRDLAEYKARLVSYHRSDGDATLQKMIRGFLSAERR